jgi:hypothetical protein
LAVPFDATAYFDDPPDFGEQGYDASGEGEPFYDVAGFSVLGYDEGDVGGGVGDVQSLEADLIAMLRADPGIAALMASVRGPDHPSNRGGGSIDISLNAADEKVLSPYIVVTGSHNVTRSIGSVKLADNPTFTISSWASTADEAETLGDAVEQAIYTTGDDLHVVQRSARVDFETLLDVSEISVDGWFDPETGPHQWREQEWPHYVSVAVAQFRELLAANISVSIAMNAADEKTVAPYAVLNATLQPDHTIGGYATSDLITFTVACWASTADEAEQLADEVENVVYTTQQVRMTTRTSGLDHETGDDTAIVTFDCRLDPGEPIGGSGGDGSGSDTFDVAGFTDLDYDEGSTTAAATFDVAGFSDPDYDEGSATTASTYDDAGFSDAGYDEGVSIGYDTEGYSVEGFDAGSDAIVLVPHSPSRAAEEMIALLRAAPQLQGLGAIILNAADEKTVAPYIVVTASIDRQHFLDGSVASDRISFTIACWAYKAEHAEQLADAVEQVFDTDIDDIDVLTRQGGFDQATTMDVAILTADRWV